MNARVRPARFRLTCLIGFAAFALAGWVRGAGDSNERFVIQSVDMTAEGKKVTPPSPENPAYYIPLFQGYRERGGVTKDYERKPPDEATARQIINMLNKQGYRFASKKFPPTLLLVFEWGSIVPVEVDSAERGSNQPPTPGFITNAAEINAVVVGERGIQLDRHSAHYEEMKSLAARHYLLISAFKYQESNEAKQILLWRAHVTTELWGNYLEEVLPLMIAHASTIVGRDVKPGGGWTPANARVIIGAPVVVPEKK